MGQKQATPYRVVMLGLDSAGKTSTLYQLKNLQPQGLIPTVGFNVETIKYQDTTFNIWDIGGQVSLRPLWRRHFTGSQAVIFVIDSTDTDRFQEVSDSIQTIMSAQELKDCPILFLANKSDLQYAMKPTELTEALGLNKIRHRSWYVQPSCATTGDGLEDGLKWLLTRFKTKGEKAEKNRG